MVYHRPHSMQAEARLEMRALGARRQSALGSALVCGFLTLATGCGPKPGSGTQGGMPPMRVVAITATNRTVTEDVHLIGTLMPNEFVELKAEMDGVVEEISFDEGERVEQGQLLVRLDETRLAAAVKESEASFKLSRASFERGKQLYADKLISQQEYDQASAAFDVSRATLDIRRRQLKDTRVRAPFSGVTGTRQISPGQVITRNTTLTWLVDLDPVKVEVEVPERFLGRVELGQTISFTVAAYPDEEFEGELYFIAPRLDLVTRTVLVKTRIPNPDLLLKAGMVANLDLRLDVRENAVVIPEAALMHNGDLAFVYLVDGDQMVALRPVIVGERLVRWVEILEGITVGDLVIVEGHQKIGPGMPVAFAPPEKAAPYLEIEPPKEEPRG